MTLEQKTRTRTWLFWAALVALSAIVWTTSSRTAPADEHEGKCAIEQRLDRLETMFQELAESHVSHAAPTEQRCDGCAHSACAAASARKSSASDGATCGASAQKKPIFDTNRLTDLQERSTHSLEAISSDAVSKVQQAQTSYHRMLAAQRQYEAVCKAYDHHTVPADQVRQAIQRRAEAHRSYASSVCGLSDDAEYESLLADLVGAEQARRDLKQLWSDMADRGATPKEIGRVKNEYQEFQARVEYLSEAYRKVEVRKVYHYSHRGAGQTFHLEAAAPLHGDAREHDGAAQAENCNSPMTLADVLAARDEAARVAGLRHDEITQMEKAARAMLAQFDEMQQRQAVEIRLLEEHQRQVVEEAEHRLAEVRARKHDLDQALAAKREALAREIHARTRHLDMQRKQAVELLRQRDEQMRQAIKKASHEAPEAPRERQQPNALPGSLELSAANAALADARAAWNAAHERYSVSGDDQDGHAEAQARERYFEAKSQTQAALKHYLESRQK